jgi:hypothetical protein
MLWTVALVYVEAWDGLMSRHPDSLMLVGTLLSAGLADLFQAFPEDSKMGKICTILEDLLTAYLRIFPDWQHQLSLPTAARSHSIFLENFFLNALPSVKKLAQQRNLSSSFDHISSIALNCTFLSCGFDVLEKIETNFCSNFLSSDFVAPQITASYLLQLLRRPDIMLRLKRDEASQNIMIHSWVRCVIELGDDYPDLQGLSR